MFKKILITFIILLSFWLLNWYANDDNAWVLYTKYIASLKKKDITPNLISLNNQLRLVLQKSRSEKMVSFYKLNNAKLKSIYNKNTVESYLINKWYTIYFTDSKNKLLVDDESIFNWYYWDKYVYPGKWYIINEKDLVSTLNSHKEINLKYAIYDKSSKKISISNSVDSKMIANLNELNNILWGYNEIISSIKWDMSFYKLWTNNWRNYLYKNTKSISLKNNSITFYNNKFEINGENIKKYSLIRDKSNNSFYLWVTEKSDIWDISLYNNLANKDEILYVIASNLYWWKSFDLDTFSKIKTTTDEIIRNKNSKDDKIKAIYDYIIDNTTYDYDAFERDKNLTDMSKVSSVEPYSWLGAFKNKKAVCNWYIELMYYMVSFAGINDIEKIDGKVTTYQAIWQNHTWLRIWDKYYDPTFDDGLSARKYYWLSKSVMLWDRIVGFTWNPLSLEQVFSNYVKLSASYDNDLIKWYKSLYDLWITKKSDLNTENLKKKLWEITKSQITSWSKIYVLDTPTSDYYLMLVSQLWTDFWKWKIWINDSWKVSFVLIM